MGTLWAEWHLRCGFWAVGTEKREASHHVNDRAGLCSRCTVPRPLLWEAIHKADHDRVWALRGGALRALEAPYLEASKYQTWAPGLQRPQEGSSVR